MRIALCCKETLVREALSSLLSHEGGFDVVASKANPRSCIVAAKDYGAVVIVVDSQGLERSGLEFLMGARSYGNFAVVLINGESEDYTGCGVDKVYSRGADADGLILAIRALGGALVRTSTGRVREARGIYSNRFELSRREFEVASLIAKGYPNRKISSLVMMQEQSLKNLVSVILRKLKCENRVQVALLLSDQKVETGE